MKTKLLSLLALMLTAVSGAWADSFSADAYAADATLNGVSVTANQTVTINEGVTVTVNNGLTISTGVTLTVTGGGSLVVNGAKGANGEDGRDEGILDGDGNWIGSNYIAATPGSDGGPAITINNGGKLALSNATVIANGGEGGKGGQFYENDNYAANGADGNGFASFPTIEGAVLSYSTNGTDYTEYASGNSTLYRYMKAVAVAPVSGITLSETSAEMTVGGEALTLTATVAPDNATDKTVAWTTSDASVASVADGVVTAVGAGTATITATATNGTPDDTSDDKTATCTIEVSKQELELSTYISELTMTVGESKPRAEIIKTSYTGKVSYKYGTSQSDVVEYKNFNFNAKKVGEAIYTITITPMEEADKYNAIVRDVKFTVVPVPIQDTWIEAIADQTYTGSAIEPTVTVKNGETELALNTDYTVEYSNNVEAGTATVTVTGEGNYTGTATATFNIVAPVNYSTSVNIEQLTLDNGVKYDITKDFINSYIEYASINALDTLNDLENKAMRNEPYLGLKLKTAGAYIKVMVKKGSTLNAKLGAVKEALGVSINGTAQEAIAATDEGTTYSYEATDADAEVVFTTASNKTVVFKQIMIDEPLADITLPEPGAYLITVATPENGTAAVNWADKKYRTPVGAEVTVTATPAEGYELENIMVTGATSNQVYEVVDGKFTMPSEEVTVSATFKEESYVKLSDYAFDVNSEFIDDPDYGKEIEAKLTYKSELTGSYQNEFTLNATFNYEVVDKNGTVVTSGTQSPFSVSSNAVTIYIDGLEEGTEYTIRLTSAKVTDFDTTTFEEKVVFNQVTDLSGAPLASATFTTSETTGINNVNGNGNVNQKADGKYVENGKIVIYRNGAKYTVGGKKMK